MTAVEKGRVNRPTDALGKAVEVLAGKLIVHPLYIRRKTLTARSMGSWLKRWNGLQASTRTTTTEEDWVNWSSNNMGDAFYCLASTSTTTSTHLHLHRVCV